MRYMRAGLGAQASASSAAAKLRAPQVFRAALFWRTPFVCAPPRWPLARPDALHVRRSEVEEEDPECPKPQVEEACKPKCINALMEVLCALSAAALCNAPESMLTTCFAPPLLCVRVRR